MQPTYNMETQLPALIGDYLARQEKKQDNLWIVKPWNMARTIDTTVTGSLPALLRLVETGPKICQKYIEKPALYQGRKFDLRYIVLLRSIQPLEIFLSDVFWVSSVFQVPPRNVEQVVLLVLLSGGQVYCLLPHD